LQHLDCRLRADYANCGVPSARLKTRETKKDQFARYSGDESSRQAGLSTASLFLPEIAT
jgi:hypothetical protein